MTRLVVAVALALALAVHGARAATCQWVGSTSGGRWMSVNNWLCTLSDGNTTKHRPIEGTTTLVGDNVNLTTLADGAVLTDVQCFGTYMQSYTSCGTIYLPASKTITLKVSSKAFFSSLKAGSGSKLVFVDTCDSDSACQATWLPMVDGDAFRYTAGLRNSPPSGISLDLQGASLVVEQSVDVDASTVVSLSGTYGTITPSLETEDMTVAGTIRYTMVNGKVPVLQSPGPIALSGAFVWDSSNSVPAAGSYLIVNSRDAYLTGAFSSAANLPSNSTIMYNYQLGLAYLCVPQTVNCSQNCGLVSNGCAMIQCPNQCTGGSATCKWAGAKSGAVDWSVNSNWLCGTTARVPGVNDTIDLSTFTSSATISNVACGSLSSGQLCGNVILPATHPITLQAITPVAFSGLQFSSGSSVELQGISLLCPTMPAWAFVDNVTVPSGSTVTIGGISAFFTNTLKIASGGSIIAWGGSSTHCNNYSPGVVYASDFIFNGVVDIEIIAKTSPFFISGKTTKWGNGSNLTTVFTNGEPLQLQVFMYDTCSSTPSYYSGAVSSANWDWTSSSVAATLSWPVSCADAGYQCGVFNASWIGSCGTCSAGSECNNASHTCVAVSAISCSWNKTTGGSWTDASNWACGRVPVPVASPYDGNGNLIYGDNADLSLLDAGETITNVRCYSKKTQGICGDITLPNNRAVTLTINSGDVAAFKSINKNGTLTVNGAGSLKVVSAVTIERTLTVADSVTVSFGTLSLVGSLVLSSSDVAVLTTAGAFKMVSTSSVSYSVTTKGKVGYIHASSSATIAGSFVFSWSSSTSEWGSLTLITSGSSAISGSFTSVTGSISSDSLLNSGSELSVCWPSSCSDAQFDCGVATVSCRTLSCGSCSSGQYCLAYSQNATCQTWSPATSGSYSASESEGTSDPKNRAWKGVLIAIGSTIGGCCLAVCAFVMYRSYKKDKDVDPDLI